MNKQKPQTINHQAVHQWTNRNPRQFTTRQTETPNNSPPDKTETPQNSPLSSSPPGEQNPSKIHIRAAHHCTNRNPRWFTIRQFTTRQKPLGCSRLDRNPRQFTIGQFTTGQTETLGLFTTQAPDNSSLGCSSLDKRKPQTIHHLQSRGVLLCNIICDESHTHRDTYSQDGRLLKVDADSDLVMVTGGELSQVIILSMVNCLCSTAHLLHPSQLH